MTSAYDPTLVVAEDDNLIEQIKLIELILRTNAHILGSNDGLSLKARRLADDIRREWRLEQR